MRGTALALPWPEIQRPFAELELPLLAILQQPPVDGRFVHNSFSDGRFPILLAQRLKPESFGDAFRHS